MEETVLRVHLSVEGLTSGKTLTLKDPNENLTLSGVQTAFSGLLTNGWLLAGDSTAFSSVSKAEYVTTTEI